IRSRNVTGVQTCALPIFIDDLANRKAQCGAGVAVCTTPYLTRCCRSIAVTTAHALGLDALAWVDISGAWLCHERLAAGDHFAVDAAGDLECCVDALAAYALDGDFYFIVELDHAVHGIGPTHHGAVVAGEVLRGGR